MRMGSVTSHSVPPILPYRPAFPSAGSVTAWVLQVPHTSCSIASPSLADLPPPTLGIPA